MPTNLESQILKMLKNLTNADRPATFNDLARAFGTTAPLISSLAHQMVDKGLAQPSFVDRKGVPTMYGLMPQPAKAAPATEVAPATQTTSAELGQSGSGEAESGQPGTDSQPEPAGAAS